MNQKVTYLDDISVGESGFRNLRKVFLIASKLRGVVVDVDQFDGDLGVRGSLLAHPSPISGSPHHETDLRHLFKVQLVIVDHLSGEGRNLNQTLLTVLREHGVLGEIMVVTNPLFTFSQIFVVVVREVTSVAIKYLGGQRIKVILMTPS